MNATAHRIVEFRSEGATLRGRLYTHGGKPRPTVVMTHGFSATVTAMTADRYAEALHAAGLNALLFDHRGFGLSDGEPRHGINRWIQARGYRDAIALLATHPEVDATRIAIWGDSHSAATAIGVAAFDERVRALVVQVPACGAAAPPADRDGAAFRALHETFHHAVLDSLPSETTGPMAVVSSDQLRSPSLLPPITAFRWFIDYGGRPGTRWENVATVISPKTAVPYHAGLCTRHLRIPSFWAIARDDEMPGAEPHVARLAFDAAPEPKQLLEIDGGHFGLLYHPSPTFDRVSAAQASFLVSHLAP